MTKFMKSLTPLCACIILLINVNSALCEIREETVNYKAAGLEMKGVMFYDSASSGKQPGILVVHEWWGLNDYAKMRARMLAELGYTAFAVDMYGDGKVALHPDDAKKFSSAALSNFKDAAKRFETALEILRAHPSVDPKKIGAIGYCFGGGLVLNMARAGVDLNGVVSFHGGLKGAIPVKKGAKTEMLVCNGEADSFIPADQVTEFKQEMDAAGVPYQLKNYPGAKHGFTNKDADRLAKEFGLDVAYDQTADQASWNEMKAFFKRVL